MWGAQMTNIQPEFPENEGGLQLLREDVERNPNGEQAILTSFNPGKILEQVSRLPLHHPEFDSPENWVPMGKGAKGRPRQNQVVILQDRYRDELQCRKCSGKGFSVITCRSCNGAGWYVSKGNRIDCPDCISSDFDSPAMPKSTGFLACNECKGTGQAVAGKTGIVTATDKQEQPSTGVVKAVGKMVKEWHLGQRVLFSKFAGIAYECEGRVWRVMSETYPIMEIVGDGDVQTREGL
jgi:co-chaperonin GroES (HSP10)